MSWKVFLPPLLSERIHVNGYYFFLKCFMEFTGEVIWSWNPLWGQRLKNLISLEDKDYLCFLVLLCPLLGFIQGIVYFI